MEVEYLKEGDIFNKIKEIISNECTISNNKMDILYKNHEFEIKIDFLKDKNNKNITRIMFMKGDNLSKTDTDNHIFMKDLLSINAFNNLISFLLKSHEVMDIETKLDSKISLVFSAKQRDNIGDVIFNKFILTLNAEGFPRPFSNRKEIIDNYFYWIIENFYEKLKDTNYIKLCKIQYYINTYIDIINSLDEKEFNLFISLLTKEDLCNILINLPYDRFLEVFNDFEEEKKNHQSVKK